jgi:hypothetical protein
LQGVVPNPTLATAYPIAGFSWLEMYQCYNSGVNVPVQLTGFLYSLYAGGNLGTIINSNGFSTVPFVWLSEVYKLLDDPALQPGNTTDPSSPCSGKLGAT